MNIVDFLIYIFLSSYFTEIFFYYNLFYVSNAFQEIYFVKMFYFSYFNIQNKGK